MIIRKHLSLLKINRNFFYKFLFAVLSVGIGFSFYLNKDQTFSDKLNQLVVENVKLSNQKLDSLALYIKKNNHEKAIFFYESARYNYKCIEFYLEYHFPFLSKYYLNSALVNKAEYELAYKTIAPHGFQVIESYLYSNEIDSTIQIGFEIELLKKSFNSIETKVNGKYTKTATTIDMLRFEIIRIMSLYLNGYDCTINKRNLEEVKTILFGFENIISLMEISEEEKNASLSLVKHCQSYLAKNAQYDSFNRLEYIVRYLVPLYEELYNLYQGDEKFLQTVYAINIRRKKFYDEKWLNGNYFSVVLRDSLLVNKQVELGKLLFFDPILSGNNQRACASCHSPKYSFGSNIDFNLEFSSNQKLKRNTPSLLNVLFQKSFFVDGRSLQLEDQVSDVLTNHKEMYSTPIDVVKKLQLSKEYKSYFKSAFENTQDTVITYYAILKSIAEFERKLITLNSRFDKYLRGESKQLSYDEIQGYTIFSGKALCGSCHFFPLFNGLTPPFYSDNEFEVIGTPENKLNTVLSSDSGRFRVSKNKIHLGAFKTPGIRNISKTAPYMHNGVYNNLDEIIEFYRKGGGKGVGLNVVNQTLPFDSLQLNKTEILQLKKFILALNDSSLVVKPPKTLPLIKGYENRKVGGNY
ncbi:MAG: cytochrome c peroxidase [Bacteroidota bacterium]|nr:cytochrome c peroxidase [Bacteroidota bacterium]